jgi:hypothetical protein
MRIEIIQFIVPLAFLAVWAITALFNRDAQPLPPRPMGGTLPDGLGRGGGSVAGRAVPSGPARYLGTADQMPGTGDLKANPRWSSAGLADRPGAERRARAEDGVVILETESRATLGGSSSPLAASRAGRAQSSRRGGRARPTTPPSPPRSAETGKPRALSGLVNRSLAEGKARPLEIEPLSAQMVPIHVPLAQSVSASVTSVSATAPTVTGRGVAGESRPAVTCAEIRSRFAAADKLREIAILSEILQPPVSVRPPRRFR